MSKEQTGGPAFPRDHRHDGHNGMTLRDYFAAKAMQSLVSAWASTNAYPETDMVVAECAYTLADAMLRAREAT